MAVDVVLPEPARNENASKDVSLTFVECSPFIKVGMTKMGTLVLRNTFVFGAVVHVDTY